jgi:RimJ/RimL family protein N-acetyltransferase
VSRVLYGHDADVIHWVCERIPHLAVRIPYFDRGAVLGPAVGLGVIDDDGLLIAGVVFHGYDPFVKNIEVSCAASTPKWGNREIFRSILRYAFETADCRRCTAVTPRRAPVGATSPRKFLEGLGFVREGSIRFGFGDQNAIIYGLLREDWQRGPYCRSTRRGASEDEGQSRGRSLAQCQTA